MASASISSISSISSQNSSSRVSSIDNNQQLLQQQHSLTQQHNHQHDVIRICVLLFDNYQRLCLSSSLPSTTLAHIDHSIPHIQLSRQSAKESILPGLVTLKDIFQNKIIFSSSNHSSSGQSNEFLQSIDSMIQKIESMQFESPNMNSTTT